MANEKIYSWRIAKATPSTPRLSTYNLGTLKNNGETATFEVTRDGDGIIIPTASKSGYVNISVSGTTVTVVAINGGSVGAITITVRVGEGRNYLPYNKDDVVCSLVVEPIVPVPFTTLELNVARYNHAAGSVGNYTVFGGGNSGSGVLASVEVINSSASLSSASDLRASRQLLAAASVGQYLVFAGGATNTNLTGSSSSTDAYGQNLNKTSTDPLYRGRFGLVGVSVGNYALFAGGHTVTQFSNTVDAFYFTLTSFTTTALSTPTVYAAGASVGDYAIIAGGRTTGANATGAVIAYNSDLTTRTPSDILYSPSEQLCGASNGTYAIFVGGLASMTSTANSRVNAYDSNLTRKTASLSYRKADLTGTRIGEYAAFSGGQTTGDSASSVVGTVEVFDASLTRRTLSALSVARSRLASATVGNKMVVAGGANSSGAATKTVDVYELA